jgi:hypothetical protein
MTIASATVSSTATATAIATAAVTVGTAVTLKFRSNGGRVQQLLGLGVDSQGR